MDITPSPYLFHALANQNLSWPKALGELIDNSFDAGAQQVTLDLRNRTLKVMDDGRGVKDISRLAVISEHVPSDTTALGHYGIGLKDTWAWCGGKLHVRTVRRGVLSVLEIDPVKLMKSGTWTVADPTHSSTSATDGTVITLPLKHGRNAPSDQCYASLAWMFTPGLMEGKQIAVIKKKKKTLAAVRVPQFLDSVTDEFDVAGKKVRIQIGILSDGDVMPYGPFWIAYRHRNITKSGIGCGDYSTNRMGGIIELLEGWSLLKNKDDLSSHKVELGDAVYERIHRLLQKAATLSQDVESSALRTEIENMLNESLKVAKREARTQTNERPGTIVPKDTGRKRRRASKTSDLPGSVRGKDGKRRGFKIDWYASITGEIGEYDPMANRVRLNYAHRFVELAKEDNNSIALLSLASAILSDYAVNHAGDSKLLFSKQDFGETFGSILSGINIEEKRNDKTAV